MSERFNAIVTGASQAAPALCARLDKPRASDFTLMLALIGAVAASAGILPPILTYWISINAGSAQGWELGKQAAAVNLGVTVDSVTSELLFDVPGLPGAPFILTAALAMLGVLLSLGLPKRLGLRTPCLRPLSA